MTEIVIDPMRPIADGIVFDDLHGLSKQVGSRLAARGVVFCTKFRAAGRSYGGNIIAASWPAAEMVAFGRGTLEPVGNP